MAGSFVKKLGSVEFGFYTAEEAKMLGMAEIIHPNVYDSSKVPTVGGLADPRLGISPGISEVCQVCLQDVNSCPGHLGCIPLTVPVFNPFTLDIMVKLLKAKCTFCHRVKITDEKAELLVLKKKLCKRGKLIDAGQIEEIVSRKTISESSFRDLEELIETILEEKNIMEEIAVQSSNVGKSEFFSSLSKLSDEVTGQIWRSVNAGVCPHCKMRQMKIKKEADNKVVRLPLKER